MRHTAAALLCLLLVSTTSSAWEADVHYGLTRWLAAAAGLRPDVAERIADADWSADRGTYNPATWAVGLHVIALNDRGASRQVQKLHFPSYGPVPGPAKARAVDRDSSRSRDWLKKETSAPIPAEGEDVALEELGLALHSLQDSWSHEGVPDIAGRCLGLRVREELSWAHPIDRGGWLLHDADQTYRWQGKQTNRPIDMARATFDHLVEFGEAHRDLRSGAPLDWRDLRGPVEQFIAASTKDVKADWFRKHDHIVPFKTFANTTFTNGLSIPDNANVMKLLLNHLGRAPQAACDANDKVRDAFRQFSSELPRQIEERVPEFLKRWLVDRQIGAASEFVDMAGIGEQLAGLGGDTSPATWTRKFLTMWLLDDHGFVNAAGHGLPNAQGYSLLPIDPSESQFSKPRPPFPSLAAAIDAPGVGRPYAITEIEWPAAGRHFAITFRLRAPTSDTLMLVARQLGDQVRITKMFWVVQ